jgi:hypothetical protein
MGRQRHPLTLALVVLLAMLGMPHTAHAQEGKKTSRAKTHTGPANTYTNTLFTAQRTRPILPVPVLLPPLHGSVHSGIRLAQGVSLPTPPVSTEAHAAQPLACASAHQASLARNAMAQPIAWWPRRTSSPRPAGSLASASTAGAVTTRRGTAIAP